VYLCFSDFVIFRIEEQSSNFEASTRVLLDEIRSDMESGMQAPPDVNLLVVLLSTKSRVIS
jgi:hypothetical protein